MKRTNRVKQLDNIAPQLQMDALEGNKDAKIGSILMKLLEDNPDAPPLCLHRTLDSSHVCPQCDSPPKNVPIPCTPLQLRKVMSPQNLELDSDTSSLGGWSFSMATPRNPSTTKGKPLPVSSLLSTTCESTTTDEGFGVVSDESACRGSCKKEEKVTRRVMLKGHEPVIRTLFPRPSSSSTESLHQSPNQQPDHMTTPPTHMNISPKHMTTLPQADLSSATVSLFETPHKQQEDSDEKVTCSQELFGSPEIFSPNLPVSPLADKLDRGMGHSEWSKNLKSPDGTLTDTPGGPPLTRPLVHSTPLYPLPSSTIASYPPLRPEMVTTPRAPGMVEHETATPLIERRETETTPMEEEDVFDMLYMSKSQLESRLSTKIMRNELKVEECKKVSEQVDIETDSVKPRPSSSSEDKVPITSEPRLTSRQPPTPEMKTHALKRKKLTTKAAFLYPSNQPPVRKRMRIREASSKDAEPSVSPPTKKVCINESPKKSSSGIIKAPLSAVIPSPKTEDFFRKTSDESACIIETPTKLDGGGLSPLRQRACVDDTAMEVSEEETEVGKADQLAKQKTPQIRNEAQVESDPVAVEELVIVQEKSHTEDVIKSRRTKAASQEQQELQDGDSESDHAMESTTQPFSVSKCKGVRDLEEPTLAAESVLNKPSLSAVTESVSESATTSRPTLPRVSGLQRSFGGSLHKKALKSTHDIQLSDLKEESCSSEIPSMGPSTILNQAQPTFVGFKTASGASVSISEAALNKAKDLIGEDLQSETFHVLDKNPSPATPKLTVPAKNLSAFTTPSLNKPLITSSSTNQKPLTLKPTSMQRPKPKSFKAPRLANSVSKAEEKASLTKILRRFGVKPDATPNIREERIGTGFSTASGSKLSASHSSMMKARRLLASDKENGMGSDVLESASGSETGPVEYGTKYGANENEVGTNSLKEITRFKTASGKGLSVSIESLEKARKLTSDSETELPSRSDVLTVSSAGDHPPAVGFQTASGKGITVSSEALARARTIISETESNLAASDKQDVSSPSMQNMATGFKTAGGSSISISKDSLHRARQMIDAELHTLQHSVGSNDRVKNSVTSLSELCGDDSVKDGGQERKVTTGFSTAGGKAISVSSKAMRKAEEMAPKEEDTAVSSAEQDCPDSDYTSCLSAKQVESLHCFTQIEPKPLLPTDSPLGSDLKPRDSSQVEQRAVVEVSMKEEADDVDESATCFFSTQVVKQFLDFSEDEDTFTGTEIDTNLPQEDELSSPTSNNNSLESLLPETPDAGDRSTFLNISDSDTLSKEEEAIKHPSVAGSVSPSANMTVGIHLSDLEATFSSEHLSRLDTSNLSAVRETFSKSMIESMDTSLMAASESKASQEEEKRSASPESPEGSLVKSCELKDDSNSPLADKDGYYHEDVDTTLLSDVFGKKRQTCAHSVNSKDIPIVETCGFKDETKVEHLNVEESFRYDQIPESPGAKAQDIPESETSIPDTPPLTPGAVLSNERFPGLMTAGGRKVEVSKEALAVVRNKFSEQDAKPVQSGSFPGLQTASGKQVSISEESLSTVKQKFGSSFNFTGLQTASGKRVEVSEQALRAARAMLDDTTTKASSQALGLHPASNKVDSSTFPGLRTASGKNVQVSEESIHAVRATLSSPKSHLFPSLQTASGKEVAISEESIHAAKATLKSSTSRFSGLQTASGKEVSISEESIRAARALLDDSSTSHAFPGLQTASGKEVAISKDSIHAARVTNLGFSGLQTASGKEVSISEESIRAARAVLDDSSTSHTFPGLQTASGKEVSISEDSIHAAKATLNSSSSHFSDVSASKESVHAAKTTLDSSTFPHLQTPNGYKVDISKGHLEVSKATLTSDLPRSATSLPPEDNRKRLNDVRRPLICDPNVSNFQPPLKSVKTVGQSSALPETTPTNKYKPVFKSGDSKREGVVKKSSEPSVFGQPQRRLGTAKRGLVSTPEGSLQDRRPSHPHRPLLPSQSFLNEDGSYSVTPHQNKRLYTTPMRAKNQSSVSIDPTRHVTRPASLREGSSFDSDKSRSVQPVWKGSIGTRKTKNLAKNASSKRVLLPGVSNTHTLEGEIIQSSDSSSRTGSHPACTPVASPIRKSNSPDTTVNPAFSPLQITLSQVYAMEESQQTLVVEERKEGPSDREAHERGKREDSGYVSRDVSSMRSPSPEDAKTQGRESKVDSLVGGDDTLLAEVALDSLDDSLEIDCDDATLSDPIKGQGREHNTENMRTSVAVIPKDPVPATCRVNTLSPAMTTTKPMPGTLLSMRSAYKRISLPSYVRNRPPGRHSVKELLALGVHSSTLSVSFSTAQDYKFQGSRFFSNTALRGATVCVGDGVHLALKGRMAGVIEFWEGFRQSPGVDEQLISFKWFSCHFQQLVWKLAALEVSYPHLFAGRFLTPDWLLLQLKYRYDREIDRAERPALRKICEHDDLPSRRMVLCVCSINHERLNQMLTDPGHGNRSMESGNETAGNCEAKSDPPCVQLTDGWYTLPCVIDRPLKHMVRSRKLTVGTKVMIFGAELIGLSSPCHPLEVPPSCSLKISTNSTRRAHWFTKLGYQGTPFPYPVSLSSVYPDGGLVGCTSMVISRVYPLVYLEKREGAKGVFRSERQERRRAANFEKERQKRIEEICSHVQKEFEDELAKEDMKGSGRRRSRRLNILQIKQLQDGEEIHTALASAPDPVAFQELLSPTQRALLESYHQSLVESRQGQLQERIRQAIQEAEEELPEKPSVSPLLKIRVVPCGGCEGMDCVLSVWRPDEGLYSILKEGNAVRVTNLTTLSSRSSFHHLQLTATKATTFRPLTSPDPRVFSWYTPRQCYSISYLHEQSSNCQLPHGELDTVGIVVCISSDHVMSHDLEEGTGRQLDSVFLVDSEEKLLLIKIWDGLSARYLQDIISPGVLLAATNLTYRRLDHTHSLPTATAGDTSVFSQRPTDQYLSTALSQLKSELPANITEYLDNLQLSLDF